MKNTTNVKSDHFLASITGVFILIVLLLSNNVDAQNDIQFNYQGVARDADNNVISESQIYLRISLVKDNPAGLSVYTEDHRTETDALGQFSITIGNGDNPQGTLNDLDWGATRYFIQLEADLNGGNNLQNMGVSPLLFVPLAAHALTTSNTEDGDSDPQNELQDWNTLPGIPADLLDGDDTGLISESDPEFNNSASSEIERTDINNWNAAFGWGNHADAGYLTNLSEIDPQFNASPAAGINAANINNWNAAYGWGNHADAGYLTNFSESDPVFSNSSASTITQSDINSWNNDNDDDPENEIQSLTVISEPSEIQGASSVKLELEGNEPVTILDDIWWSKTLLITNPPQLGSIHSEVRFYADGGLSTTNLDADEINADVLTGWDIYAGDWDGQSVHITPDDIHFHNPASNSDIGWSMNQRQLIYTQAIPNVPNNNLVTLDKKGLDVYSTSGWKSFELKDDGNGATLKLNPPSSSTPFFNANYASGRPEVIITDGNREKIRMLSLSSGGGYIETLGDNGEANFRATNLSGNAGHGYAAVYDDSGTQQAGIYVNAQGQGVVFGDTKNFRMDHPLDREKEIVYASVEGPEVAAYSRGTATLQNGEIFVPFEEHYQLVIADNKYTIQITPLSADSKGLAVTRKSANGFYVKELHNGKGSYKFDWEAKAIRHGFENHKVIQPKLSN